MRDHNHNKIFLKLLAIMTILIQIVSNQTWLPYNNIQGNIISYTYQLALLTNDQLKVTLSWPGTEDLDIYLYQQGTDLLQRNTFVDRQFSPSLNPQILEYTITSDASYFIRVDLYSSQPTPYVIQIQVNGLSVGKYYDTVLYYTAGRTAQTFQILSASCTMRISYNGPIYDIYLFPPGENVITGTPKYSDTTAVNPKTLNSYLDQSGVWTLVIHHGITTNSFSLTPFDITYETLQSDQCISFCTNKAYAISLQTGASNICSCQNPFQWNSIVQECVINCEVLKLNSTLITGTYDKCDCDPDQVLTQYSTYCQQSDSSSNQADSTSSCLLQSIISNIERKQCNKLSGILTITTDTPTECSSQINILNDQNLVAPQTIQLTEKSTKIFQIINLETQLQNSSAYTYIFSISLNIISDQQFSNLVYLKLISNNLTNEYQIVTTLSTVQSIEYLNNQNCQQYINIQNFAIASIAISYTTVLLGITGLVDPLIGLQTVGFLQLAYFSLGSHYHQIHPFLKPVQSFKVSNGYNQQLLEQLVSNFVPDVGPGWNPFKNDQTTKIRTLQQEGTQTTYKVLPQIVIKNMNLHAHLANNFNIMFIIQLLSFSILMIIKMIKCCCIELETDNKKQQKFEQRPDETDNIILSKNSNQIKDLKRLQQTSQNLNPITAQQKKIQQEYIDILHHTSSPKKTKKSQNRKNLRKNKVITHVVQDIDEYQPQIKQKINHQKQQQNKSIQKNNEIITNLQHVSVSSRPKTPSSRKYHKDQLSNNTINQLDLEKLSLTLKEKLIDYLQRFFKQATFYLTYFNAFNFFYSSTLFFIYIQSNPIQVAQIYDPNLLLQISTGDIQFVNNQNTLLILSPFIFVAYVIIAVYSILSYSYPILNENKYGIFKIVFKYNCTCRHYLPLSIYFYKFFLSTMLVMSLLSNSVILLILFFPCILFLLYFLSNLPYRNALDNYRAGIIHISQMILIFIANYFRNYVYAAGTNNYYKLSYENPNFNTFQRGIAPAMAQLYIIGIIVIGNLIFCISNFIHKIFQLYKSYTLSKVLQQDRPYNGNKNKNDNDNDF